VPRLQHPVSDELLVAIGDVTVSFALLEAELQLLAHVLLKQSQQVSMIVTAELSFGRLCALVLSLHRERYGEANSAPAKELVQRANELEELRNQIMHSVWAAGDSPGTITRIKATAKQKHGLRINFHSVTAADLREVATSCMELGLDIQHHWMGLVGVDQP
jgi:sensor histidine kinase regulating citrate/malate metabolism